MYSANQDINSITLLIRDKDLSTIKAILKFLKEKYPSFTVLKFRTGRIGDDLLVSFKVKKEFYSVVLEKFAYNDIPLIMKDKGSKEYVDQKKEQKRRKLRAQGWSEISVSKKKVSLQELQRFADAGKLKEVAKEAKGGIGSDLEIVKKAKSLLSKTIITAIENLVKYALEKTGQRQDAIDELVLIASDKDLKLFDKTTEMTKAGLSAIEISLTHKNYYNNIIKIANNSKLNNLLNVKATIAFSEIYNNAEENEIEKIPDPIKTLNTRWLKIAFETVQVKLNSEEIEKFNSFIEFIERQRNAA